MTDKHKPAHRMSNGVLLTGFVPQQRLLSEATLLGTAAILQENPAEYSPALEQAIRQGVRQAVLYYAEGLDTISRQLRPLDHGQSVRA